MSLGKRLFAAWYDVLNSVVEGRVRPFRVETAGRAWGDALEIGAGTGANLTYFPDDVRLTAVEPDPHMAKRLRRKADRLGRKVAIIGTAGESLAFADASFDTVVTSLMLCMVDDVAGVAREARRVLRPGGAFLFYEHVASQKSRGRWWQDRLNPAWRWATTGCNLNRDIAGAIRDAGFSEFEVRSFDLSVGLPVTIPNIVGMARA